MFKKILIANRGEIALRVIRTCREMGIKTVAVYSTADKESLHVKFADEAVCIGKPQSADSYLNIAHIMAAAEITNADAVHPGYGFLAENAKFSQICADHGIKFIGPTPEMINKMGDKITAKETMIKAGVPVVPGGEGLLESVEQAKSLAKEVGYPVILKATAGGGGKGMRVVWEEGEMEKAYTTAKMEAAASFKNDGVYMEKFVEEPRHIEIQVAGDQYGNVCHLSERDCSIQRRHQKLVEESPSPFMTPELRAKMGEAAIKAASAINYESVGTIEFLVDKHRNFYFMEMNTRIQVEHCVTEKAKKLFESNGVYSHSELEARHEIELEKYIKKVQIEARIMGDLAINHILPAAIKYQNELLNNINGLKSAGLPESAYKSQFTILKEVSEHIQIIHSKVHDMVEARKIANNITDTRTKAIAYESQVKSAFFDDIRYHVDKLEHLVDDEYWTLPKYREMLFLR